jgi:ATP-dependent DNA ligase
MAKQKKLANVHPAKGLVYAGKFPKDTKWMYANVKKDGLRGFAIDGKMYTSTGVLVVNAPMIEAALRSIPKRYFSRRLDGEFFYKNCRTTLGIVKTQTPDHPLRNKLRFYAFDSIPKKEWDAKKGEEPQHRRQLELYLALLQMKRRLKKSKSKQEVIDAIKMFRYYIVDANNAAVQAFHKKAVKAGHEGTMLKDPNAVYAFRKNRDWQKLKPYKENDLRIVDAEIGTKRNKTRLGALILEGIIDKKKVRTKCGGGFTDALRDELWAMHKKKKLVGKIAEIEHEGLTKNFAVRFPEFRRLHPEKND